MTTISLPFLQITLCMFFFSFFGHGEVYSQVYDQEQEVLLSLKEFWQDPPAISHWNSTTGSHCSWDEVQCTNNSVTGLFLVNMNITDIVPSSICDLRNLTVLDLSYNYIPGGFPRVLYNCSKLQYLNLSQNWFVRPIPDDVDRLSRLQHLNLAANNFSGDIPASIGRLSELRLLYLHQNQFNGTFPAEICNLSNLEALSMAYNTKFVPMKLPSNFTQLRKLTYLFMSQSNLIGEIPESIGDMAALEFLALAGNGLTGKLPSGLFTLTNLSVLYLSKNQLSGGIPSVIETSKMTEFDISENNLTGILPADLGKLQLLTKLTLSLNQFSGEIPASIGRLPALIDLTLFNNNFSGELPPDLGSYSALRTLDVAINSLTGSLPVNLCSGGKFFGLAAYDNNLSGELPKSLGNCSSLYFVNVYNNNLSGNIPSGFWTALNLTYIILYKNSLTGVIPAQVSVNLSRLEISNNKFSGNISPEISSWKNLEVFHASNNLFTGAIPQELTLLQRLNSLMLDQNQLSGNLPEDINSWKSLNFLNLSHNQLSGEIPEEIGLLPVLTDLDLSENKFSGKIPAQLGQLKLNFLNLSSNHLTGMIPSELEISAYQSSFWNNPGLCSSNTVLKINVCNSGLKNSTKLSSHYLALIISSTVAVFVLSVIFLLFIIRFYKNRKLGVDSIWKLTAFQKLNFTESTISSGLTEKNLIGSGGSGKVYCVPVNRQGDVVAVKKIWNNRKADQRLEKEFMSEVEILSSIRHCNIVKLLCCISSDNTKLLVYEYLKNRSLDKLLYKKTRPSSNLSVLDWPKRMQIAIGAAEGLCYMHHDCSPAVIHRDIKSSNILLDSEFNAKIADFGLAKILIKQGEPATMSSVAGSFGYIAPEYAHTTRVNEKIDVYGFGVILLELVTGKEAHNGDESSNLADWAWRHIQEGKDIVDALDKDIKEPFYVEEMSCVFKLGILCTATQPSSRPSMKDVLQILRRCNTRQAYTKNMIKVRELDSVAFLNNSILEDDDSQLPPNA